MTVIGIRVPSTVITYTNNVEINEEKHETSDDIWWDGPESRNHIGDDIPEAPTSDKPNREEAEITCGLHIVKLSEEKNKIAKAKP